MTFDDPKRFERAAPHSQTDQANSPQAAKARSTARRTDPLTLTPDQRAEPDEAPAFESKGTPAKGLGGEQIEGDTGPIMKQDGAG
ncbi:MAG: hypothetical protein COB65_04575, partial [Thalassobium sp.]